MRIEYKNDKLNFIIGNVRDFDSINNAMAGVIMFSMLLH